MHSPDCDCSVCYVKRMGLLVLAFVTAQLLDFATYSPWHEVNHAVLALGDTAPMAKALMVGAVLVIAGLLVHTDQRPVAVVVLLAGVAVGCVGALSNVTA